MNRRSFMRWALRCAGSLLPLASPRRGRADNQTVVDVRDFGTRGDGVADETSGLQAAVDALPRSGGTVRVPSGNYRVDATRSVRLRSGSRFVLAPDATLIAIPNDRPRSAVLVVEGASDVQIRGGAIVGERDGHLGDAGEWGYGISLRGAERVRISDIHISACWGDGICVGGLVFPNRDVKASDDVEISRVTCKRNRRQGLTIGPARRVRVTDCLFAETGGTKPGCGIDIEPDQPSSAEDIRIHRCTVRDNEGSGIVVYRNVSSAVVEGCTIEKNGGYGVLVVGAVNGEIVRNVIAENGMIGACLGGGARGVRVVNNRFRQNATSRLKQLLGAVRHSSRSASANTRHIQVRDDTEGVELSGNAFEQ